MSVWTPIVGRGFSAYDFDGYVKSLSLEVWKPAFVVVHNTFSPNASNWHDKSGGEQIREFQHDYRDLKGWHAGPHIFIADDLIWAFTPLTVPGVHSPSWNQVAWGVETVGDWDVEQLSPGTQENLIAALATLHQAAGLDPAGMRFHHEDPLTTHKNCPGANLVKEQLVGWVQDRIKVC